MWEARRWVAWYASGAVYRSESRAWQDLPASGVLVVVLHNPTGRTIMSGGDHYFLEGGRFGYVPSGEWGTDQPPPEVSCRSCIKEGVGVSDAEFRAIMALARAD